MITLTQAERLVRKIAEVAAQPASDTQTARLAQDYAALCRDASHRLEQCAIMIEAGQSLQALQLAETPPPLLDLLTVLSFRQAAEWRAFCQGHQLPWTEPFYDKYVRLLNSTYNKGIVADHPFYRDYRRAVMNNDDDRAMSILRVIARLNPSDQNTKDELKRLEEKLLRKKMDDLSRLLATGDATAAQVLLAQIEASGLPIPSSHPVWQQSQVARCQQLLRQAADLRRQDAWQDAEALVEEIHALATRNNLQLPAADADSWAALESWTIEKRAAYADDQDFRRAVSALEYEVQTIEPLLATNARPAADDASNIYNSLNAKWRETERFNRPLDTALAGRCQQCNDWLQKRIKAAGRSRRRLAIANTLLVLGIVGASVPFGLDWFQQRDFLRRLETLESSRRIADTEALVAAIPARLKTKAQLAEGLAKAQGFLAHEKELKRTFDTNLSALQQLAAADFRGDPGQTGALCAQCGSGLDKLAPEFQSAARNAIQTWDAKWQPFRNDALSTRLARAEQIAASIQETSDYNAVHAALSALQPALEDIEPWKMEPPALDPNLAGRLAELTNKFALWKDRAEQWEKAQASLLSAQSADEYFSRLPQLALSPFASAAQRDGVAEIARLKLDQAAFLGSLLLPGNRPDWGSLTNLPALRTNLMPADKANDDEKTAYFILRDDKNMQGINAYQLVAAPRTNNSAKSHPIFVQGLIGPDGMNRRAGLVYDPSLSPDTLTFVHQSYENFRYSDVKRLFLLPECETFTNLDLGGLIDPNSGNYKKSILQLLDRLNNETNSSAVFRAFVSLKLFALTDSRPREWGLQWAPDAARHLQALTDLGATKLESGDWMVQSKVVKFEAPLQKYFERVRSLSLEKQALFLQQLVRETCLKGFAFAGFVNAGGRPLPSQTNSPADYWGWGGRAAKPVLLFRNSIAGEPLVKIADPLPFTPLLVFRGDPRLLLNQAAQDNSCTVLQMAPILPPFYASFHE